MYSILLDIMCLSICGAKSKFECWKQGWVLLVGPFSIQIQIDKMPQFVELQVQIWGIWYFIFLAKGNVKNIQVTSFSARADRHFCQLKQQLSLADFISWS